jgi:hypothetical protein
MYWVEVEEGDSSRTAPAKETAGGRGEGIDDNRDNIHHRPEKYEEKFWYKILREKIF